ncbi:hypothetical protein H5U98_00060 [Mycolicibacterium boenickei]|uniref:Uncharacterized protein n=1 Tax=Mycolicibacterium boenickei TaxID=146017 RepID=A0AAX2ZWS1_9MYCO|nr:hypothetical protein [Mycolicibacterium boenickei]UNB99900.1 hypothetical protein H5U98_00060 [Mycolicibacterium boenickei]
MVPSHGTSEPSPFGFGITAPPFSSGLSPAPWFGFVQIVPSHGTIEPSPLGLGIIGIVEVPGAPGGCGAAGTFGVRGAAGAVGAWLVEVPGASVPEGAC